jgi:hypothetical protein
LKKREILTETVNSRTFPHYGSSKFWRRERRKLSLSHVTSFAVWLLHWILKNLIVLRLVTRLYWSKILIGCSGYVKSASSGVTSSSTTSTVLLGTFVTCGRCHELLPWMTVTLTCMSRSHISQGWGIVWCSEVLVFISPQTSSHPSLAKPLSTHDLQPQTLRVGISCLHNSLDVTSWLLGYLEYDVPLLRLHQWDQDQK